MFFYEIHEGDEEVGAAVLLGHEERFDPVDFFALVKKARAHVSESYEEDTLSEAIANELQRSHGFIHVTDDLLVAEQHGRPDVLVALVDLVEEHRARLSPTP